MPVIFIPQFSDTAGFNTYRCLHLLKIMGNWVSNNLNKSLKLPILAFH